MGFATALSGLNAAANNLSVTGNNIANANTTGFKESRSEFADVYASSIGGVSKTQPGSGVRIAEVAQQFNQGTLDLTGNNLDMAINGEGFFTLADNPADLNSLVYSRAGAFEVNKDGLVTNAQGQALLAYKPNGATAADGFSAGVLTPVSLNNAGAGLPVSTTKVALSVNLDASNPAITTAFNPLDSSTYTKQTSATIYDSLGASHKLTTYFVAGAATPATASTPATRNWTVHHYVTDNPLAPVSVDTAPATLSFDSTGKLAAPANGQVSLAPYVTGTSAANIVTKMDYTGSTQLSSPFSVDALRQDGLAAGKLTGIDIDDAGGIFARFSNGGSTPLGKVALTRFANPQGLAKLGGTTWGQSPASGTPIAGEAGIGSFGSIQSGALEQSNVDLSKQLVNLIIAQQTYQANSQTISTENSIIQTILNIR
jgi:flagellar hook protein FlgE